MSAQINKLKTKINSTKTTKKITKAMELVSRSKMRLFQDKALSSKEFELSILNLIYKTYDKETKNRYTKIRKKGDTFFVLFTSDKGLCGAMNNKLLNTLLSSKEYKQTPNENKKLIIIGKKGLEFARSNNLNVHSYFKDLNDQLDTLELINIIDSILKLWDKKMAKEIYMVVPDYINTMVYLPKLHRFLPTLKDSYSSFDIQNKNAKQTNTAKINSFENPKEFKENSYTEDDVLIQNIVYEPNSKEFINNLFNKMIYASFMSAFVNLKATEYSSRMIAMKNATDSANDMIDSYTLSYNRARQASITQEIAEIVGSNF